MPLFHQGLRDLADGGMNNQDETRELAAVISAARHPTIRRIL
ncbi:MAG: hypothetical protein AAF471_04665 [Myxococcota bacterium]